MITGWIGAKYLQNQDDMFADSCKDIVTAELYAKYDGKFEHLRYLSYEIDVECKEDQGTLSLLHEGVLPIPFGRSRPPDKVWHFKSYFRADPKLEVELLIGLYKTMPALQALGLHDGKEWVYEPMSYIK